MNGKSAGSTEQARQAVRPVQDEWGIYDPNQAGLQATFRALNALSTPVEKPAPARVRTEVSGVPLEPQVQVRAVPQPPPVVAPAPAAAPAPVVATPAPERGAVYTLEFPTQCPQCATKIGTVRVSRLLRTHVSFTSTLPRKGYIIVCPECDGILSAELSGLI
jgi:hypothetical protein